MQVQGENNAACFTFAIPVTRSDVGANNNITIYSSKVPCRTASARTDQVKKKNTVA